MAINLQPPPKSQTTTTDTIFYKWCQDVYDRIDQGILTVVDKNGVNQTIPNNSITNINFSNMLIDNSSNWNSNMYFQASTPGWFEFTGSAKINANISSIQVFRLSLNCILNGVTSQYSTEINSVINPTLNITKKIKVQVGDTVALAVFQNTGSSQSLLGAIEYTWFEIRRIN